MRCLDDLRSLSRAYGWRFLALLGTIYFFVKGFGYALVTSVLLPYYKIVLGVSGEDYQRFYNIAFSSVALKPILGAWVDSVPLFGYKKRYYAVCLAILGSGALLLINLLAARAVVATILFFFAFLSIGGVDLLAEGKYSELMKRTGTPGVVTWVWIWYMFGSIAGALLEGPLAQTYGARTVIWVGLWWLLAPVIPLLFGWLPESKEFLCTKSPVVREVGDDDDDDNRAVEDGITEQSGQQKQRTNFIAICTGLSALGLAILSLFIKNRIVILCSYGGVALVLLTASFVVLPRLIAQIMLFSFCRELLYMQINGILDYFYTASAECLPNGPQFSLAFYQTVVPIIGSGAGLVGVFMFQMFLSRGKFRLTFCVTTFIKIIGSFFDLMIAKRWNQTALHIDDQWAFLFGDAVILQLVQMLDFMPSSIIISRVCPPGIESTVFALLAGTANFGQITSRTIGFIAAEWLEIKTVVPCDFSALPSLIVLGHMAMPMLLFPLILVLIPNEHITQTINEPLQDEDDRADLDETTLLVRDGDEPEPQRRSSGNGRSTRASQQQSSWPVGVEVLRSSGGPPRSLSSCGGGIVY